MLNFIFHFYRLAIIMVRGIRSDQEFRILLSALALLLFLGALFYTRVEGWGWIDALYFCVMTVSTIGYGDMVPTTPESKLFTIMYALLGIGVFVAVVTKIVSIYVDEKVQTKEGGAPLRRWWSRKNKRE